MGKGGAAARTRAHCLAFPFILLPKIIVASESQSDRVRSVARCVLRRSDIRPPGFDNIRSLLNVYAPDRKLLTGTVLASVVRNRTAGSSGCEPVAEVRSGPGHSTEFI